MLSQSKYLAGLQVGYWTRNPKLSLSILSTQNSQTVKKGVAHVKKAT